MIVRFGGGNKGIAEYLEKGMKQGRMFSRDELDKRVILEGDLSLTDRIIDSIQDNGQERYLHITLSFREDEISNDTLQNIVSDYKDLLLSAYDSDEFNFYAEAHLPKIKQVKDERTGEMIERKPHIHIVIPEVNLLTFKKLSPVGLVDKHEKYLDSIQEYINHKYNLETPKDYVRNTDMHHANVLSRIKGDFFGEKQQELKSKLVDEIAKGQINSLSEFQERLSNFGEVKIRNKGRGNQYFAVKIEGDKKFTNLNHPIFNESFITDKKLPYTKPSIEKINADILEWKNRVSREIKHVNFATQSFRKLYATAEPSEKARLLADREANYELKYRAGNRNRDLQERGRQGNYEFNPDYAQERKSGTSTRETSGLSGLPDSHLVYRENQRGGSSQGILPENEYPHLRNRKSRHHSAMRWNDSSRTRANGNERRLNYARSFSQITTGIPKKTYSKNIFDKNIEQRPFIPEFEKYQAQVSISHHSKFSHSNTLSFMAEAHLSEQEKKAELAKFKEIRKNIDPNAFLSHLERVYAIDVKKHSVTYAKDGSPRFSVNKRNLNASDFLTKYLNLEWQEAKSVLSYVYDGQANKNANQERLSTLEIQRNIKIFTNEVRKFEKDIKLSLHNLNIDNRNLYRGEKKRIYSRFSSPKQRNQELAIASFRAMQRQEQINEFERFVKSTLEREKISFQQSGYSNQALEDSTMAFKDSFNLALGNEFGRISPAEEKISFADNFKQQQAILHRQLKEQNQAQAEVPLQPFKTKSLEEVMKLNNLGIAKKENGDIEYKRLSDGKTICTDVGNQMLISKNMQSPENIKTFLELAIDKYGNELKVSGSREFKEMVIETAAVHNLSIILKPASLQEQLMDRRKELQLEAKAQSLDGVTNEAGKQIQAEAKQQAPEAQAEAKQQAPEAQAEAKQQAPEAQAEAKQQAPEAQAEVKQQAPEAQAEAKQQAPEAQTEKRNAVRTFEEAFSDELTILGQQIKQARDAIERDKYYQSDFYSAYERMQNDPELKQTFENELNAVNESFKLTVETEKDINALVKGIDKTKEDIGYREVIAWNRTMHSIGNKGAKIDERGNNLRYTVIDVVQKIRAANDVKRQAENLQKLGIGQYAKANQMYDIKFTFDRKEAKYNVSINGENAKSVIAKDPNALTVLQQHPDIKKHNVPTSELQAGSITRVESMKGGNRPTDMKLDILGKEIKQAKSKDQGMER
ncbi:LPD7 domain-containing protein [Pasteurella multocida]